MKSDITAHGNRNPPSVLFSCVRDVHLKHDGVT